MNRLFPLVALVLLALAPLAVAAPPRVIRATPDDGARDVDPATKDIVVEFDQDMFVGSFSWVGGGDTFPRLAGSPHWKDARTCILPVTLVPGHSYWMSINSARHHGFRNPAGEAATPYRIAFRTATPAEGDADDGPAREISAAMNVAAIAELRRAIDDSYSYAALRAVDWDDLFQKHRDHLIAATTRAEFATRTGEMLAAARDMHIWLEVDGRRFPSYRRPQPTQNFSSAMLRELVPDLQRHSASVFSGQFDDGTGYVMVTTFSSSQASAFDAVFEALARLAEAPALVLDVRPNGGGDELMARELAGCFLTEAKHYASHVTRAPLAPGGFTAVQHRVVRPNEDQPHYAGPVAVLTGPFNMSSCEAFLLMMKQVPGAVLVGATSYGSSGNPKPHRLANDVVAMLPSWKAMDAKGVVIEGRGIGPDIEVIFNATQPRGEGEPRDPVLAAARAYLAASPGP